MQTHRTKEHQQSQGQPQGSSKISNPQKEKGQKSPNPFMKFLQDSGDWVAEKYNNVTDGIGDTAQRVGHAADELWDVVTNTNMSFNDTGIDVETDLDEVMDLVPMDLGVILDREASDNVAQIHFAKDGSITIKSSSIALGAVNINGIQLSGAMLKGVHVHIRREKNGLIPKIKPEESQITINIDSAIGSDISVTSKNGPIEAKEVELSNLHVVTTGKQAPFDDSPAGNINFSVGSVVVRGLNGAGAEADSIAAQNASGTLSEDSGNIHAGTANASNLKYNGNHVQQAELAGVNASFEKGSNGDLGASVTAASAAASGIDTAQIDAQSFSSSNLQASGNLQEQSVSGSLGSFSAKGIQSTQANLDSASGNGVTFAGDIDDKTGSAGADKIMVQNLESQHGSLDSATMHNLSAQGSTKGGSGSIGSIHASGANSEFGSVDQAGIQGLNFSSNGTEHSASMKSASMTGANSEFGSVEQAGIQGIQLSSNGKNHSGSLSSASITGAKSEFGSVGSASVQDVNFQSDGTNHSANLVSAQAKGIQTQGASIDSGSIQGASLSSNGTNHNVSLTSMNASGIQAQEFGTIDSVEAQKIQASSTPQSQQASIQSLGAKGINGQGISIDEARALGVQAGTDQHGTHASLLDAHAQGTNIQQDGSNISVDMTTLHNARVQQNADQTSFQLGKGKANGISVQANGAQSNGQKSSATDSGEKSTIDTSALISSASKRIESGSIRAGADLNAQDLGMAEIEKGTHVLANIDIENNRIQDGSKINTSKAIDGPAWISADGAYVDKGQLMGDVNGFFDINAGKHINKAVGLDGKKIHSIGSYGSAIANQPKTNSNDGPGFVDASSIHAEGQIQLSNGTIDAGSASMELAGTQSGDNQVAFSGREGVVAVEFARFITSSLSINTDAVQVEADSASVSEGSLSLQADKQELNGSIGNVTVEGVEGTMNNSKS